MAADWKRGRRRLRRAWVASGVAVLLLMPVYVWWTYTPRLPDGVLLDSDRVRVTRSDRLLRFAPSGEPRRVGLLWVSGCLVPREAYAPLGRAVAEAGYVADVYELPWRCAPWPPQRARALADLRAALAAAATPTRWVLGGHSKDAVFVSAIAAQPPASLAGVVIAGSTHPRDVDLSALTVPVTKLVASMDGVAPAIDSERRRHLLPTHATWVRIEGGTHAQFAWYGHQIGDGRAAITREQQHAQLVDAVLATLRRAEASRLVGS